jgi:hypothetical protein
MYHDVGAFEVVAEKPACQATRPFIEIACDDPMSIDAARI